jgi:hypothetical protein
MNDQRTDGENIAAEIDFSKGVRGPNRKVRNFPNFLPKCSSAISKSTRL